MKILMGDCSSIVILTYVYITMPEILITDQISIILLTMNIPLISKREYLNSIVLITSNTGLSSTVKPYVVA